MKNKKRSFAANKRAIASLPENKREIAEDLLEKVIFMAEELDRLQGIIREKGWTEPYQNGKNQFGVHKTAETDAYNNLIKNYNTTIKTLSDMIPDVTDDIDPVEKEFFG